MRVTVLDYGLGNLKSVAKAFAYLGVDAEVTDDRARVARASLLVVPGVSAFGACIERLRDGGYEDLIREHVERERPYLGICLGYQILFESSEENEGVRGLGILRGRVRRFPAGLIVPHMGWNTVRYRDPNPFFHDIPQDAHFYFVHSYFPEPEADVVLATTEYGIPFASAVATGPIVATQFHPEKSSRQGLRLLDNVYRWCAA